MTEKMSPELARRLADHLRAGVQAAEVVSWDLAPAVLRRYVTAFAEQLEDGHAEWVIPTMTAEQRHAGVLANSPFGDRPANTNVWDEVDELRREVAAHLVRVEGTPNGYRKVGYFAVRPVTGPVKFYRVTAPTTGRYDGRTFVDAVAGGEHEERTFPGMTPAALVHVLSTILADPAQAAGLYARELGRCSRCARILTDEESRRHGMGPDCRALTPA